MAVTSNRIHELPAPFWMEPTFVSLLRTLLAPVLAVAGLLLLAWLLEVRIDAPYRVLILLIFLCVLYVFYQWDDSRRELVALSYLRTLQQTCIAWAVVVALLALLAFCLQYGEEFSRRLLLTWALLMPLLISGMRYGLNVWLTIHADKYRLGRTAIIAGINDVGRRLAQAIATRPGMGLHLLGWIEDRSLDRVGNPEHGSILGRLSDIPKLVKNYPVDVLYITLPIRNLDRTQRLLHDLQDTTISIYFVPDIFVYDVIQSRVDMIDDVPTVALCESPFIGMTRLLKRSEDLVLSTVLLLLAAPIMFLIAFLLAATTLRNPIFSQRRYGLDGKEIVVYKFRTMTTSDDGNHVPQVTKGDKRITRLGRFLRCTSLDELPQLINVLQGRMSLVGPRPHAVAHNEIYRKLVKGYMIRHKVPPGITGLAQVSGHRGETRTPEQMEARLQCDLEYVRNWSVFLDLKIMALTAVRAFRDKKAY